MPSPTTASNPTALILSGGGARAAYQVGVLKAIAQLAREQGITENPFPILVGTSAGAINATALAAQADNFQHAVANIVAIWENFHTSDVYASGTLGVARTGARWLSMLTLGWIFARWLGRRGARPRALLDNTPLAAMLEKLIAPARLDALLASGHLQALAVTASSYSSGEHYTFYQAAAQIEPWVRSQRMAVREPITVDHLLASSAIPFIFPARLVRVENGAEYFGDGAMRQSAPISPAIHLGAQRILIVGVGRMAEPHQPVQALPRAQIAPEPSLAQIAGHALSSIFLDSLAADIERLKRINHTLGLMTPEQRGTGSLRPIDLLVISPSQRLDEIAARHTGSLPPMIRALLGAIGATHTRQAALASYLLFESSYTRELIALGERDTLARREDVIGFLKGSVHETSENT